MSDPRAVVLRQFGSDLEVSEFRPVEPPPGGAVVTVTHGGICGTDVYLQEGRLPIPTPVVLGHEAVGEIKSLGAGLTADAVGHPLRVGDRVVWASSISCGVCYFCVREHEKSLCVDRKIYGINRRADEAPYLTGGWADEICLQAGTTIVRLPDEVTSDEAISLGCAGPTIVHGLLGVTPPKVGEVVVIQGSGPVGMAAAMYSRLAGAGKIILVGGPSNRLALAKEMGACDVAVDIFEHTDPDSRVRLILDETPDGRGADLVVEATGVPAAVTEGIDLCRKNGRYLVVGQYTDHGPTPLNPHDITRKQLKIFGSWAFAGEHYIDYVRTLPSLAARFDLSRLVTHYPLEAANEALADMRSGKVLKPVLRGRGPVVESQ